MSNLHDDVNGVKPTRAVCDARSLTFEDFKLPTDGRKWRAVAKERRALFMELASYANDGDGSGACPSIKNLQRAIGSRRSTFRRLDDLKKLGLVVDEGKSRFQGTVVRRVVVGSTDDDSPTTKELRATRERRRKQERDGVIPPGSAANWEQLSRIFDHAAQKAWAIIDEEDAAIAAMVPDSSETPIVPGTNVEQRQTAPSERDIPIVPDSRESTPMVPNGVSMMPNRDATVPDSAPMVPSIVAREVPCIPPIHTFHSNRRDFEIATADAREVFDLPIQDENKPEASQSRQWALELCEHGNAEGKCNAPYCRNVPTLPGMGHGGMPRDKSKLGTDYPC
jgi:hypothetical protein